MVSLLKCNSFFSSKVAFIFPGDKNTWAILGINLYYDHFIDFSGFLNR